MLRRSLSQSDIPGLGTFQAKILSQDSFGDSITAGYAASVPANNYVSLIGTTLGVTPVNHGVSGREAVDQTTDIHAFAATDTGSQLITYMTGTNDGTFYGTDIIRVMNWKIIHQEQLAWLSMPARAKTTGQGYAPGVVAAPTYTGTWTNSALYGGAMSKQSSTQGSTATFTGFGRTLYLAYGIEDGNGGSFIVTVDPHAATISIASPGVITETAHTRKANDPVRFDTDGALPTGLSADTIYYVVGSSITTDTYQVSATAGGAAINTSGTQSGTHTVGTPFQKTYVIDPSVNSTSTFTTFDAAGIYINGYGSRSTIGTYNGTIHASALLRITGLTRAAHTIVAKVTSATGAGNVVWFDWFGQPHGSFFLSGPTVIAAGPPRMGTDYLNSLIQPYSEYIRYNVSVMQRDGLNVGFAGLGGYINPASDLIADNTHPNDSGMSRIADAFLAAINTNAAARTRQSGEALSIAEGSSTGMVRTDTAGNAVTAIAGVDYMAGSMPTFTGWMNQSQWFPALADYGLPYQASTHGSGTYSAVSLNKEGSYGVWMGYSNGATIGSAFTGAFVRVLTGDQYCVFTGSTSKAFCIDSAQAATFFGGVTFSASPIMPLTGYLKGNGASALTASATVPTSDLSGVVAAANGGAGSINGALKGNGSGTVSQAAASDLSNGTTGSGAVALATNPQFGHIGVGKAANASYTLNVGNPDGATYPLSVDVYSTTPTFVATLLVNTDGTSVFWKLFQNKAFCLGNNNACQLTIDTSQNVTVSGTLKSGGLIAGGSVPTNSGSCAINTQVGGATAGSFKANGACSSGTIVLSMPTAANGWDCGAKNLTTPATLNQTAYTTTSVTFSAVTMASGDQATFKCQGF